MNALPSTIWLIVLGAGLPLVGAVLLFLGLRGRRIGNEPRCRQCNYILTGLASEQCPECGAAIDEGGVVRGVRRRIWPVVTVGVLMLLLAAGGGGYLGYQRVQNINKYRFYPFSWVLADARAGAKPAVDEIVRRYQNSDLDTEQIDAVVDIALAIQGANTLGSNGRTWINLLGLMARAGDLDNARYNRFWRQLRVASLAVRSPIRVGDPLPIAIEIQGRGPSTGLYQFNMSVSKVVVGDAAIEPDHGSCILGGMTVGAYGSCFDDYSIEGLSPGDFEVAVTLKSLLYPLDGDTLSDSTPLLIEELTLTSPITILPADAPDPIKLIADASMKSQLRSLIGIGPARVQPHEQNAAEYLSLSVDFGQHGQVIKMPIDLAFDVFICVAGEDPVPVGQIRCAKGRSTAMAVGGDIQLGDADVVGVILRTNADAARSTTDLIEIWDGELVFEDIPVTRQ